MNGDVLALIGTAALLLTIAVVVREKLRPSAPRYGRESDDWGDQPNVLNLFHNGTINRKGQRDHVRR